MAKKFGTVGEMVDHLTRELTDNFQSHGGAEFEEYKKKVLEANPHLSLERSPLTGIANNVLGVINSKTDKDIAAINAKKEIDLAKINARYDAQKHRDTVNADAQLEKARGSADARRNLSVGAAQGIHNVSKGAESYMASVGKGVQSVGEGIGENAAEIAEIAAVAINPTAAPAMAMRKNEVKRISAFDSAKQE